MPQNAPLRGEKLRAAFAERDRANGRKAAEFRAEHVSDDYWQGFAEGLEKAGIRLLWSDCDKETEDRNA